MLGLATCAARFSCMWCLCPSDSYHLFDRVWEVRTLEQAREAAHSGHEPFTCQFPQCDSRNVNPATESVKVKTKGALDKHQQTHGGQRWMSPPLFHVHYGAHEGSKEDTDRSRLCHPIQQERGVSGPRTSCKTNQTT